MTVSSQTSSVSYLGDGVTTLLQVPYYFLEQTDLVVTRVNADTSTTTLILGSDFSVSGAGVQAGGEVTMFVAPVVGVQILINRVVPVTQETDYVANDPFPAESHERALDKLTMLCQQAFSYLARALLKPVGKNYYDAGNSQIKNLGDGVEDPDAVNIRTMRDYVDAAIAGVVGGFGFFLQAGAGAIARTFQSKMRDVISVKDFGAIGDGINDDTAAFLLSGTDAYVPEGTYFIDTMTVDIDKLYGPGEIHAHNGQVISLQNDPIGSPYVQRRVMAPVFGGAGGIPGIYPTSTNAPQGLSRFRHPVTKEESFFISQFISGLSWSATERSRDTRWVVRDDGQPQSVAEIGPLMKKTHAHLSTIYENDQIWMYQSFLAPDDAIDNTRETGCGWSKYPWRGDASSDAELINYRVWGRPGSGHRYQDFGKACVQLSQDGRYMIMVGINYGDAAGLAGGRTVFVYDRLEVESAANPLDCEPVYACKTLLSLQIDSDTAYQGETTDGRFLYIVWGSAAVFGTRGISVYTITGDHVRNIHMDGSAGRYSNDELRNGHPTLGICTASEPEGIAIYGDKLYVTFTDNWAEIGDVTSYNGNNYLCAIANGTSTPPDEDTIRWRITDLPATSGAWVANKLPIYSPGPTTLRDKVIYELTPPTGRPDEEPTCSTYRYPSSVAQLALNAGNLVDMSIAHGGYFRMSVYNPSTGAYRPGVEYASQSSLRIRDTRTFADNSLMAVLAMEARAGFNKLAQVSILNASSPTVSLYAIDSPANAGSLFLGSAPGIGETRLFVQGGTRLNATLDELVLYKTTRFITNNEFAWGTASRVGTTIYLQTAPVVSSDARLKTKVRDMEEAEISVGRKLAREFGFYKWLCSIDEKGEDGARWHSGMTVQRAIAIFEEEGLDPLDYGAICHDSWSDEFEMVEAVFLGSGRYEITRDKDGNEVSREEIMEKWADAAERQTLWAGDKFSFREPQLHALVMRALAYDQDQIMQRLDALEGAKP